MAPLQCAGHATARALTVNFVNFVNFVIITLRRVSNLARMGRADGRVCSATVRRGRPLVYPAKIRFLTTTGTYVSPGGGSPRSR